MITIKDVAKKAGVSTATASRALHNIGHIKDETLQKVLLAAKELGFVANATAQSLKSTALDAIGIIVSDIRNEYYWKIVAKLQNVLKKQNKQMVLAFSAENPAEEEANFRYLIACRVSVIIFTPASNTNQEIIDVAIKNGIRVLQLYRDVYPNLSSIINDDEDGCYQATKFLIENQCKKLLLVDVEYDYLRFEDVLPCRSTGFLKALKTSPDVEQIIVKHKFTKDKDLEIVNQIHSYQPDGIIAGTNISCMIVMDYFMKNNKHVNFVSFDDNKWLNINSISAIQQNNDILIDSIVDYVTSPAQTVSKIKIPCTLIKRHISI